ncbi:MAG: hypothetical protein QM764_18135 [Chitinophagaceae bacterium]
MKKWLVVSLLFIGVSFFTTRLNAQCSVCTRTAQQLGEKPAKGLNAGILYLAFAPFAIGGYIFYRWRKDEKAA